MKTSVCHGVAAFVVLAGWLGCSGGRPQPFANSVPVVGDVVFKGERLAQGLVRFVPSDAKGQPATGAIKDGRFSMSTTVSSPGVIAGRYQVAIVSERPAPAPPLGPDGLPPRVDTKPESLIPIRYSKSDTSGLEVDVQVGLKPLLFELQE